MIEIVLQGTICMTWRALVVQLLAAFPALLLALLTLGALSCLVAVLLKWAFIGRVPAGVHRSTVDHHFSTNIAIPCAKL